MRGVMAGMIGGLVLAAAAPATAQQVTTILYHKAPNASRDDGFVGTSANIPAFLAGSTSFQRSTVILSEQFAIGGLDIAGDGRATMLYYRKDPTLGSDDIYVGDYASIDTFLNGFGDFTVTPFILSQHFAVGGLDLTSDGLGSMLFYRKDPDAGTDDIYLGRFSSMADLLAGTVDYTLVDLQLDPGFGVGGLDIASNGATSVIFYRTDPAAGTDDVYMARYASINDFIAGNGSRSVSTYALGSSYGFGGLSISESEPPTSAIPEPASWAMLIAGFGLTGAAMRRRRQRYRAV